MATYDPPTFDITLTTVASPSYHHHSGTATVNGVYVGTTAHTMPEINWIPKVEPIISGCVKHGHVMNADVVELEDGGISGMCEECGQLITGRRVAGGMSLLRLRKALEDAVNGEKELVSEEFLALAAEVDAEEEALAEARSLLRLAERALFARNPQTTVGV